MNLSSSTPPVAVPSYVACIDCRDAFARLLGNLSGFAYRRRHDSRWTMEFVGEGCRDVLGYDPHRFIGNASIAFGELVARADWRRVNERVRLAAWHRQRATVEYHVRSAHGALVLIEDRFTPVINAAGELLAIEGIIDRPRPEKTGATPTPPWGRAHRPDESPVLR